MHLDRERFIRTNLTFIHLASSTHRYSHIRNTKYKIYIRRIIWNKINSRSIPKPTDALIFVNVSNFQVVERYRGLT